MNTRSSLLTSLAAIVVALVMVGCSESDSFQAYPCKVKGNDNWSLVALSGKVMADNAFEHRPTAVTCNRLWAQNEQGYWELFSASDCSRPIGDKEYRYVSYFHKGRAIVAERDKPVTIIDVDGEIEVTLDSVDGKRPDYFHVQPEGLAIMAVDTVQGLIDFTGRTVIPAKYYMIGEPQGGRVIAFDRNMSSFSQPIIDSLREKSTATVFDYDGNVVFTIGSQQYDVIENKFTGGYLPIAMADKAAGEDKLKWGLLGPAGEVVVAPSARIRSIVEARGKHFIFGDDKGLLGLRSIEGEVPVKPKYTYAYFIDDNHIAGCLDEKYTGEEASWEIIGLDGTKVGNRAYLEIASTGKDRTFVKTKPERWSIMKLDGEMLTDVPVFTDIYASAEQPCQTVMSDHIDIGSLIDGCNIDANSMDGITFQSSVRQALERQARYFSSTNKPQPSNYTYTNEVNLFPTIEGEIVSATVTFPSNLSHQTYRNERVIDFVWGNYYWYHDNRIPTGYVFSSEHPSKFTVTFNNYGKLRGKLRLLYNSLVDRFGSYGTITEHSSAATLIDIGNGRSAIIALEPNSVKAVWGRLSGAEKSVMTYDGNKENLSDLFADSKDSDFDIYGSEGE